MLLRQGVACRGAPPFNISTAWPGAAGQGTESESPARSLVLHTASATVARSARLEDRVGLDGESYATMPEGARPTANRTRQCPKAATRARPSWQALVDPVEEEGVLLEHLVDEQDQGVARAPKRHDLARVRADVQGGQAWSASTAGRPPRSSTTIAPTPPASTKAYAHAAPPSAMRRLTHVSHPCLSGLVCSTAGRRQVDGLTGFHMRDWCSWPRSRSACR